MPSGPIARLCGETDKAGKAIITRKRFNGAEASVRYGVADDYDTFINSDDPVGRCSSELRRRLFQIESIAEAEAIFLEYLDPVARVA